MSLTTLTVVDKSNAAQGPLFFDRVTLVGDAAYVATGTTGLQAIYAAAVKSNRTIVAVVPGDCGDAVPSYDPVTDKLFVRVMSTGVQAANGDLSASTYKLTIISR